MKVIGSKKHLSPEKCLEEQARLIAETEKLRPYQKPEGIILKFPTWEDLDRFNTERAARKT